MAIVDDLLGTVLINAGPSEKGTGVSGRIVLKSYNLTRGSGNGRPCLSFRQEELNAAKKGGSGVYLKPKPIVKM